ncbi:MAG: TetR family transcriptional regulator, partial [Actinomycetota bacterium]|nr:TetR family transcriptional regulator [Actinomycetota bacterium]
MSPERTEGRATDMVDAAIKILGTHGARALTHRAVDRELGIPEGSTSNYFRTRHALLEAVFRQICALDAIFLERLAELGSELEPGVESVVRLVVTAVERWIVEPQYRQRQRARIEIYLISSGDEQLANVVSEFRDEFRQQMAAVFAQMGVSIDQGGMRLVISLADGMILDELIAGETGLVDKDLLWKVWAEFLNLLSVPERR